MSRYQITNEDLKRASLTLQLGEGISSRIASLEADEFILDGEEWAEDQVSSWLATPLKPIPARGETELPDPLTTRNFPREFILGAVYWALSRIMHSEYFQNEKNASESAVWAEEAARTHIMEFRSRPTTRVGAGRRRNPNPFVPPTIAPAEDLGNQRMG